MPVVHALLALVLAGCDSPLAPSGVAGTYVLVSIEGSPIPALYLEDEWSSSIIIADTLRLGSDRSGERITVQETEWRYPGHESTTVDTFSQSFTYALKDRRIEISFFCPPFANCAPPPHIVGRATGDRLELTTNIAEMIYERR